MKTQLLPALKLTLLTMVFLAFLYPALIWGVAQFAHPNKGGGDIENVGQKFNQDRYFWSRPSAVGYNAAGSGGSNKGPSNPDYLAEVQTRIDTFLLHNPTVKKSEIPVDMVTASGSGLDPHISVPAALVQMNRVAVIRKLPIEKVENLVEECTEKPTFGLIGTNRINVLKLNTQLDKL